MWCLDKSRANCHGVERGRGTAREEGEGILQYGSYVLPQFSEFYTSRAHLYRFRVNSEKRKGKRKWDAGTSKKVVHIYFNKIVGLRYPPRQIKCIFDNTKIRDIFTLISPNLPQIVIVI